MFLHYTLKLSVEASISFVLSLSSGCTDLYVGDFGSSNVSVTGASANVSFQLHIDPQPHSNS